MIPGDARGPSLDVAHQLFSVNRPELAERELRGWLSLYPDDPEGHALLAWALAVQGRPREAAESGQEAVRLAPDWAYTHLVLAEVSLRIGDDAEAERCARAALALDPDRPEHYAVLAAALLNQGTIAGEHEALRATQAGLAVDADHAGCARLRAQALSRLRRHGEARQAAAYALRLAPDHPESHTMAGFVEIAAGTPRRGRELMREAVRLDPGDPDARRGLRLATQGERYAALLLVQAERWAWPLRASALAYLAELGVLLARKGLGGVNLLVGYSLLIVAGVVAGMLWARRHHPEAVEELRLAGAQGPEAREGRRILVFLVVLLLFAPLASLLG